MLGLGNRLPEVDSLPVLRKDPNELFYHVHGLLLWAAAPRLASGPRLQVPTPAAYPGELIPNLTGD
jgi:hypothetical protein